MLRHLFMSLGAGLALMALTVVAPVSVSGQAQTAAPPKPTAAKKFVPKRLAWGDADISGNFTTKDEANTPFERPDEFAGRRIEDITPEELAAASAARKSDALERAPFLGQGNRNLGIAIGVPIHWLDHLDSANSRPWFVVDPPDGKIPPINEEGKKRAAQIAEYAASRGSADSYTDRDASDRCIAWTNGVARPIPGVYGMSHQILQTKDFVAIRYEMVHETRIIPIAGRAAARPHNGAKFRSYYGDAVGRWEGDTFVVETTNYNSMVPLRGSSENLRTIERFTRVAPNRIEWSATIEDPATWSRPWTFAIPWTENDNEIIHEYACHEGNYGLRNILSGARSDERRGIKASDAAATELAEDRH